MDEVTWFVPFEEDLKHDRIVMRHGDNERIYVPERKKGKWIVRRTEIHIFTYCSNCGADGELTWHYCRHCGAKMEDYDEID